MSLRSNVDEGFEGCHCTSLVRFKSEHEVGGEILAFASSELCNRK